MSFFYYSNICLDKKFYAIILYHYYVAENIIDDKIKNKSNTKTYFVGIKENMNVLNNQRYQSTEEKIKKALFSLLKIRKYNDISIKEICYEAGINRSSFYAHYQDINDLMIKTEQELSKKMMKIFNPQQKWDKQVFEKMFDFLYENRIFYKSYLTTNEQTFMEQSDFVNYIDIVNRNIVNNKYNQNEVIYHMAFFAGGIKAMSKSWIMGNCKETPQQMSEILMNEYKINSKYFN